MTKNVININACEFEECFEDKEEGYIVHYYTYPKELSELDFETDLNDDKVSFLTIAITEYDGGLMTVEMSPTVYSEEDDAYTDVEWEALVDGVHYDGALIDRLLATEKERCNNG